MERIKRILFDIITEKIIVKDNEIAINVKELELLEISLSVVLLGIILLFAIFNYKNTINTATSMMDRFINGFLC